MFLREIADRCKYFVKSTIYISRYLENSLLKRCFHETFAKKLNCEREQFFFVIFTLHNAEITEIYCHTSLTRIQKFREINVFTRENTKVSI